VVTVLNASVSDMFRTIESTSDALNSAGSVSYTPAVRTIRDASAFDMFRTIESTNATLNSLGSVS
jgi:hypothetical protein